MTSSYRIDSLTTDFSSYSHILGNNEFDADMDIVESFVRSYQQPENVLAQSAVMNYYISRLLSYWDFTKEYATSDKILEDLKKTLFKRQLKHTEPYSVEYIESIEQELMDYIQTLQSNFITTPIVDIKAIQRGFQLIGNIACMWKSDEKIIRATVKMYPLPNTIGLFGLNTYLYALFEGIYLIGVPNRVVYFDLKYGCPSRFIQHDVDHNTDIKIPNHQAKIIYYTILNDPNLSRLDKECHITNIWIQIHEIENNKFYRIKDYNVNNFIEEHHQLYAMTGDDFADLYHSFDELTQRSDFFDSLSQEDQRKINELIAEEKYQEKSFRSSFVLANLYTGKYIRNLLD